MTTPRQANTEMQEQVEGLAIEIHEFRNINFNPGDVNSLVKSLRLAADQLENLDEQLRS